MSAERGIMNVERRPRRAGRAARAVIHRSSLRIHHSPRAFTLVEMLVVAGIIAIILGIAIASLRALTGGVQEGNARTMLKTLLASARAEAASRGHVVGVRFGQYRFPPAYPLAANVRPARLAEDGATFGVIVYPARRVLSGETVVSLRNLLSAMTDAQFSAFLDTAFAAVGERDPVRFPQGIELAAGTMAGTDDALLPEDTAYPARQLRNNTTFTVLFSPNGQVAVRKAFVIQRHNRDSVFYGPMDYPQPDSSNPQADFMPRATFTDIVPLLLPDDLMYVNTSTAPTTWPEISQNSLWLYDQNARKQAGAQPWTNYLMGRYDKGRGDVFVQINPYTGQLQKPSGP